MSEMLVVIWYGVPVLERVGELVRIEAALLDLADTHRKVIDAIAAAKKSSILRSS